jgi:hypothetical protein
MEKGDHIDKKKLEEKLYSESISLRSFLSVKGMEFMRGKK